MKIEFMNLRLWQMIHYFLDFTSRNAQCISVPINNQTTVIKMQLGGGRL